MSDWQRSGQEAWNQLASDDAYWAVLTDRTKNDRDLRSFFVSGQRDVARILDLLNKKSIQVNTGSALDYGCGVGRLSRALSAHFNQVTGVDVSVAMLDQARQLNHPEEYAIRFQESSEFFTQSEDRFDLIISLITLQHIERPAMIKILKYLMSRLSNEGILVFQLPSRPRGLEAIHYWVKRSPLRPVHRFYSLLKDVILWRQKDRVEHGMSMDGLEPGMVEQLIEDEGMKLLAIEDDSSAGPQWESFIYIVSK